MRISEVLQKIRKTTKRNEKSALLESLSGQEEYLFKRVAVLTYSPHVNFWIKDIDYPETNESDGGLFEDEQSTISLDKALDRLEFEVSKRGVTGHKARDLILETYKALQDDEKDAFRCVVDRDLKSGISIKSINKVWPELVYDHPYMRGSSFSKKNLSKINFPCFSQTKEDGEYEDIIVQPAIGIEQRARSGAIHNEFLSMGVVNALRLIDYPVVLMGEIIAFEDTTRQKLMSRQKSNGYLSSNEVDPERLLHVIWDMVPYDDFKQGVCTIEYEHRLQSLKVTVANLRKHTDQIRVIDSRKVNSVEEIIEHFKQNVEGGLEGVMVKNTNMAWKDGTSTDQVKVKIEFECDLKIVGFNQGKTLGEWDEKVGSIIYESADGKINVNVGTGLTDEDRVEIWNNRLDYMKKISTIKSNDVISSELKPDTMSLFLPRITKLVRTDKTKADSFERVIEQKDAFVETLMAIKNL